MMQTAMTLLFGSAGDAQIPTLGASGAIAAVMGAYFVLYPDSRISTLVLWFPVRIPAWIFLGGWFLYQFFEGNYGLIHPSNTGGSGVAFFAHVGGFIFGAVVAGFLSGRDASPSRRHDGPQRRSVRRDGPVMPVLPDDGKFGTENLRRQRGYGWPHRVPGRRRLPGDTNLGDHDDFRGLGVQRCNRLGTNVIPGTTRYLLGCSCRQELVRSVVANDIDTFARRRHYRVVTVRNR